MFDLFGTEMPLPLKFFIAFATVLALIGLTAWLVRRFGANRLGGANTRGRQPRLAVIDAATVDQRRRLVLIRRDNVEHLLMIGGPTDLVVEPNIVRAAATATREVTRVDAPRAGEPALRQPQAVENAWPLQPAVSEPPPAPRSYRAPPTEEPWLAPEPGARPRPAEGSLTGLAAELSGRLHPAEPPATRSEPPARHEPPAYHEPAARHEAPVHIEPPVRTSATPPVMAPAVAPVMPEEPAAPPQTDHNLAEMAQQLEAALRRAPMPEGRPPVTDALAVPPKPARDYKLRVDPQFEARQEIRQEPRQEPKVEARLEPKAEVRHEAKVEPNFEQAFEPNFDLPPEPRFERPVAPKPPEPRPPQARPQQAKSPEAKSPEAKPIPGKTVYDSLEEEMANLLGRPPGKP